MGIDPSQEILWGKRRGELILPEKMMLVEITPDGNCFLELLKYGISDKKTSIDDLRKALSSRLEAIALDDQKLVSVMKHPVLFFLKKEIGSYEKDKVVDYIRNMKKNSTSIDFMVGVVLVNELYSIGIDIYRPINNKVSDLIQDFKGLKDEDSKMFYRVLDSQKKFPTRIIGCYHNNHFDLLRIAEVTVTVDAKVENQKATFQLDSLKTLEGVIDLIVQEKKIKVHGRKKENVVCLINEVEMKLESLLVASDLKIVFRLATQSTKRKEPPTKEKRKDNSKKSKRSNS